MCVMNVSTTNIFWIELAYMTEDHIGNCYWNQGTKRPILSLKRIGIKIKHFRTVQDGQMKQKS